MYLTLVSVWSAAREPAFKLWQYKNPSCQTEALGMCKGLKAANAGMGGRQRSQSKPRMDKWNWRGACHFSLAYISPLLGGHRHGHAFSTFSLILFVLPWPKLVNK
ncbi:hypothetical protein GALMADRAFT_1145886 [Galerina marginata CBS 339.88]|uniref:Uncharacterized protein n=1 Tax=Galerina marginata (strain CBS 339.88) TaxID=685588 RepID=A0A067SII3_GALM3|nr:hypothetical protein GALMADRAFT_1145886 [Galerina marginata CBS 339.88]